MPIRAIIIEDHTLMRESVRRVLEAREDITVVAEITDGTSASEVFKTAKPDVVIIDLVLPGENGVDVVKRLKAEYPDTRFIIYTGQLQPELVRTALDKGASGYIRKTSGPNELLAAIDATMRGEIYLCPATLTALVHYTPESESDAIVTRALGLSERELDVLRLVVKGLRNKEIAADLGISVKTVETHRARVMARTGCTSPAELVRFAIKKGLADL